MSDQLTWQGTETVAQGETRGAWLRFTGALVVLIAVFNVIIGVVALTKSSYFTQHPGGPLLFNLTAWGWVHIAVGAVVALLGVALYLGAVWAGILIVLLAMFNALAQLAFLAAFPFWSTIVIFLDVLVIWAIMAHGQEPGPA